MKTQLTNRLKTINSKKIKTHKNQRKKPPNMSNFHVLEQTVSLSDFHQARQEIKLVNINAERSKGWSLSAYINQRIL